MKELCLACAGIVLESLVFFSMGSLLMRGLKLRANAAMAYILGYLSYMCLFELITVPATLLWVPLTVLARAWVLLMAVIVLAAAVLLRKIWVSQLKAIQDILRKHSFMIFAAAVVFLQCLIVVLYMDTTADAAYYVGTVSTSVYTDTLARYNPFNGKLLTKFQARYIFSAYPMHNAVWCRLIGMHAIVQAKIVMSSINVLIANLIIYQIGKRLFDGNEKKADLMVVFVCMLQLFTNTIYTAGTFFFTRSYEGKALLGNVAIPMVLLCAVWFWQEKDSRNVWITLFLTALSAITFSGSAIIFPAVISVGVLPVIFMRKQFSKLIPYLICILPSVLYAAVYFASRLGWITLSAS